MFKPEVDQTKCIGCGMCTSLCPQVFKIMEDSKAHVITDNCGPCDCQNVVDSCPVDAISLKKQESSK